MENIYADIAARTGGNIYVGVVGPVRTGTQQTPCWHRSHPAKST